VAALYGAGLADLPDIEPSEEVWARVRSGVQSPLEGRGPTAGPRWRPSHAPLALAAGLILALGVGFVVLEFPPEETVVDVDTRLADGRLTELQRRSMELDALVRLTGERGVDPTDRAFLSRIADLDQQLAAAESDEAQRLWGQRVALLESLAEVRRSRAVLRPAVY
jgi:hypothetical protein